MRNRMLWRHWTGQKGWLAAAAAELLIVLTFPILKTKSTSAILHLLAQPISRCLIRSSRSTCRHPVSLAIRWANDPKNDPVIRIEQKPLKRLRTLTLTYYPFHTERVARTDIDHCITDHLIIEILTPHIASSTRVWSVLWCSMKWCLWTKPVQLWLIYFSDFLSCVFR